ncbi:hypothetical protein GMRT_13410 [Giardia muris]|uniref:Uncharacterized protein n=1 Tax=Giardia muris TaxID=5742 RepID=A0A4Z1SRW3_GIAMU|nr:hypothetical protein GMRT_13410 [Giardia muris]|eukprot:TNJ26378.1 hypothetical protein GMRT_13410 [Giardia muris]
MARKKTDIPEDPTLRNEYFNKFAASALHDADYIAVYIDAQLSGETGIPSVASLLATPACREHNLTIDAFTSTRPFMPETISTAQQAAAKPGTNLLLTNPNLYFGFWGTQYNATMDIDPGNFYETVFRWVRAVVDKKQIKVDTRSAKKPPPRFQILTTCTDGHGLKAVEKLEPAFKTNFVELDGSVTNWVCARPCQRQPWSFISSFRFAVDDALCVQDQPVRQGRDLTDPTPQGLHPILNFKRKYGDGMAGGGKGFERIQAPTSEHPRCVQCGCLARPQLKPTNPNGSPVPMPIKTWYATICKEIWPELEGEAMETVLRHHYTYWPPNKKPQKPRGGCRQKLVIIELGCSSKSALVRAEHDRVLCDGKGTVNLIRIAKNEGDLARDTSGDEQALEQAKAERVEINFENLYYPIVAPSIMEGISTLQDYLTTREEWIQEWDDPKRRALKYSKKKG